MRTAFPEQMRPSRMAVLADRVLLGNGVWRILSKANGNGVLAAAGFHVSAARSVARFAAPCFQRGLGMGHRFTHDGVLEAVVLVLMAGNAGLAAHIVAVPGGSGCGFSLFLSSRRIRCVLSRRPGV